MNVIGSGSGSREYKGRKSLFLQCKTSIGNNSGSIKHRATKFAWGLRLGRIDGVTAIFVT